MKTREQWLKEISECLPWCRKKFLERDKALRDEELCVILYENDEAGDWQWSLTFENSDFWMDSFDTKEEARGFCGEMGWSICE
jgi:hypothetical protein